LCLYGQFNFSRQESYMRWFLPLDRDSLGVFPVSLENQLPRPPRC
jgi:hypothetical protein